MPDVGNMVIIGCGAMGCDVAAIFLSQGWRVQAVTRDKAKWVSRADRVRRSLNQLGTGSDTAKLAFVGRATDVDWTDVAFALESVPEDFALKRAIFRELDVQAPAHVPLLTNTSGYRISEIASGCATRRRMAGLHFFMPAHLVPAVEVVKGEDTDPRVVEDIAAIMRSVRRVPIKVAKDVPGFLANRIQHALMREAFAVIDEGLGTPEDVDAAVRFGFGFRYVAAGPILLKEISGLDTQLTAGRSIYPSLNNDTLPSRTLQELVAAGRLGMKTGHGFRRWSQDEIAGELDRFETALIAAAKLLIEDVGRRDETRADER